MSGVSIGPAPRRTVPSELYGQGTWLSEAAEAFGDAADVEALRQARDTFATLREGQSPEGFELESNLTGGARDHELIERLHGEERTAWRWFRSRREWLRMRLMDRLRGMNGFLVASGEPLVPGADREWIPTQCWYHLRVDWDAGNVVRGEGLTYWYVRVLSYQEAQKALTTGSADADPTSPTTGRVRFSVNAALPILTTWKVELKRSVAPVPTAEEVKKHLATLFDKVPREAARLLRRQVWGKADTQRPGRRPGKPRLGRKVC